MKRLKKIFALTFAVLLTSCSNVPGSTHKSPSQLTTPPATNTKPETTPSQKFDEKFTLVLQHNYLPLNFETQKAVWFSYIDLADMLTNKSEMEFANEISTAFDKVKDLGLNTVYVHVRPFGDAFYNSKIYPTTRFFDGNPSDNPPFDALEIMVNKAHERGLSIHAWINPLRCEKKKYFESFSNDYLLKKWYDSSEYFGKYLLEVDNSSQLWLNPAYIDVRKLICDGVAEIVENYKVDGVHIDDYFYPTTDEEFDKFAFSQSEFASVTDFRLQNTNTLVSEIYATIKAINPDVLFGISPQGNIGNNYTQLYADVENWAKNRGFCDYIVPQIYYGFENEYQPFGEVAQKWSELTSDDIQLVFGLAFYKVNEQGEFAENTGIISLQLDFVSEFENYGGIALYNYKNIFEIENSNCSEEISILKDKL